MKIKLLLIGILIWSFNAVFGQTSGIPKRLPPPDHPVLPTPPAPPDRPDPPREIPNPLAYLTCGTPHPVNPTIYRQETDGGRLSSSDDVFCINVFFHIVRNSNGSEPEDFTTPDLDEIIDNLNQYYNNPHNIIFNNAGSQFIDNTDYVNIENQSEATKLGQINNRSGFINYYITKRLWRITGGGFVVGTANTIPSNNLVIVSKHVLSATSAHEVGHCLNLLHTFETSEGIDITGLRPDCETKGDLVCDTPPDANMRNQNGYSPDLTNIMSYYHRYYFLDHFTNGQGKRMRDAIEEESVLQGITENSCTTISQVDLLCFPETRAVSLTNLDGATTTWTSSSNVLITSSTNTNATFRALNLSRLSGDSWIRATLNNGLEFTERFDVYHAFNSNNISLSASSSYTLNDSRWNTVDAHYNGSLYWDQNYTWEWQVPESFVKQSWESHSFIHVRPNTRAPSIYIQVRGCHDECGCSDWKGRWFRVRQSNSSGSGSSSDDDIIEY